MNYPRFKQGDNIIDKTYGGKKGFIKSLTYNVDGLPAYWIEYSDDWIASRIVDECELELDLPLPTVKNNGCECGAFATGFPNIHSTWCPKFKSFS